jgi:uncharacterized protein YndB with AHSA1/START domain
MTYGPYISADRDAFDDGFSAGTNPRSGYCVNIARCFHAEPERVFNAWVDPELARLWLFRSPASAAGDFHFDLRVGGRWKVSDRNDPAEYAAVGQYRAIEPPHRLVFTMAMPQFSAEFDHVAVEIRPDGQGCILTLAQEGLAPGSEESFRKGWSAMFDDLVVAVS